ncbi:MAG: hypothetical protein JRJ31_16950 [Deltaproteobacteria bacterium]|nr:hypothetical protein [Deltaproteobacteria bacterium]
MDLNIQSSGGASSQIKLLADSSVINTIPVSSICFIARIRLDDYFAGRRLSGLPAIPINIGGRCPICPLKPGTYPIGAADVNTIISSLKVREFGVISSTGGN